MKSFLIIGAHLGRSHFLMLCSRGRGGKRGKKLEAR